MTFMHSYLIAKTRVSGKGFPETTWSRDGDFRIPTQVIHREIFTQIEIHSERGLVR